MICGAGSAPGGVPRLQWGLAENDGREDFGLHELVDALQAATFRAALRAGAAAVFQQKSEVISKLVHGREFIICRGEPGYQLHPKLASPKFGRAAAGNGPSGALPPDSSKEDRAALSPSRNIDAVCLSWRDVRANGEEVPDSRFPGPKAGLEAKTCKKHRCVGPPSEAAHPKYRTALSANRLCAQFAGENAQPQYCR